MHPTGAESAIRLGHIFGFDASERIGSPEVNLKQYDEICSGAPTESLQWLLLDNPLQPPVPAQVRDDAQSELIDLLDSREYDYLLASPTHQVSGLLIGPEIPLTISRGTRHISHFSFGPHGDHEHTCIFIR